MTLALQGGLLPCSTSTTHESLFFNVQHFRIVWGYRCPTSPAQPPPTSGFFRLSLQPVVTSATKQKVGNGSGKIPVSDDDCTHAGLATTTSIVVGTSDGIVRFLDGPKMRHCGRFASLSEDGVLSILELLGYRSSQVKRFFLSRWLHRVRLRICVSLCLRKRTTGTRRSYSFMRRDSAFFRLDR